MSGRWPGHDLGVDPALELPRVEVVDRFRADARRRRRRNLPRVRAYAALIGVETMTLLSGTRIRTLAAAAGLAVAGSLALAAPAGAVGQASAESQFRSAGIGWTSSGGCTDPGNSTCTSFEGHPAGHHRRRDHAEERQRMRPDHHRRDRDRPRGRHLQPRQRLQARLLPHLLPDLLGPRHLHLHRPAQRRRADVRGGLRQRLRRRGQPLGRHVLHLRLLVGRRVTARGTEGDLSAPRLTDATVGAATLGRDYAWPRFCPRNSSWAGSIRRQ